MKNFILEDISDDSYTLLESYGMLASHGFADERITQKKFLLTFKELLEVGQIKAYYNNSELKCFEEIDFFDLKINLKELMNPEFEHDGKTIEFMTSDNANVWKTPKKSNIWQNFKCRIWSFWSR